MDNLESFQNGSQIEKTNFPLFIGVRGKEGIIEKKSMKMVIKEIPLSEVIISKLNVRKDLQAGTEDSTLDDLARSIHEKGLLNPITVLQKDEKYEVVVGQRRYLACQLLGWNTIPSIVRSNLEDSDATILSLVENIHRADLNPIDKAGAYSKIHKIYGTFTRASKETGVSIPTIKRYMLLLDLAPTIQKLLTTSDGPAGISALSKLAEMFPSFEDQEYVFERISGFKQQVQLEILKRSDGEITKIDLLCQQALGGCFNIFVCRGLDNCPHIPKEYLEKVKKIIALAKDAASPPEPP